MATIIGTALLLRLIATKAGIDLPTAIAVLDAEAEVVAGLVSEGARVRVFNGLGSLLLTKRKATRRLNQATQKVVDVSEKEYIKFLPPRGDQK